MAVFKPIEKRESCFIEKFFSSEYCGESMHSNLMDRVERLSYRTTSNIFEAFFDELRGFTSKEQFGHDYFRLRIGPTFDDLLNIMGGLWRRFSCRVYMSDDEVYYGLSTLLDGAIDDGVVVPTVSRECLRIFRPGESALPRRALYAAQGKFVDIPLSAGSFTNDYIELVNYSEKCLEDC